MFEIYYYNVIIFIMDLDIKLPVDSILDFVISGYMPEGAAHIVVGASPDERAAWASDLEVLTDHTLEQGQTSRLDWLVGQLGRGTINPMVFVEYVSTKPKTDYRQGLGPRMIGLGKDPQGSSTNGRHSSIFTLSANPYYH